MNIKNYCYSRHTFLAEDLFEQVDPAKWGITRKFISNEGCTKRKYCKPCAAMLYAETGDVNKRSDYLCDLTNHLLNSIEIISEKGDLYPK